MLSHNFLIIAILRRNVHSYPFDGSVTSPFINLANTYNKLEISKNETKRMQNPKDYCFHNVNVNNNSSLILLIILVLYYAK